MKYLIINGSPHKGNTWSVTMEVKKKIEQIDKNSTFDEVQLNETPLPFCTGCSNCFRKGGDFCPHKGIMNELIAKMEEADGIIVSTTTFNCRETAMLKNFLDHMNYMLHRPRFFTQKAIVITTVGGVGGKKTVKSVADTLRGMGVNRCYAIAIQSISWNAYHIIPKHEQMITREANKFCKDVLSQKMHYPSNLVLIPYNIFRGMGIYYKKGTEYATEDGVYYQDEYRKNHVYDCRIPVTIFQKIFGNMFYLIGKMAGKGSTVTYRK